MPEFQHIHLHQRKLLQVCQVETINCITCLARDEKVGNFPVRMLVILVKLCKLVELKKQFIVNLTTMNDAAEKMNLYENKYPPLFKVNRKFHQQLKNLAIDDLSTDKTRSFVLSKMLIKLSILCAMLITFF